MLARGLIAAAALLLLFWARAFFRARAVLGGEFGLGPEDATPAGEDAPPVSIVLPARNEEDNIEGCVRSLLASRYPEFEVVVVDDNSEDRTAEVAASLARGEERLVLVAGQPLPDGWCGKTHALDQGVARARHDWLLMTDADTTHHPDGLAAVIGAVRGRKLQALSLYPRLACHSFWERLVQPSIAALIENFMPLTRVNDPGDPLTWANGQYFLVHREAYERAGGMQGVRSRVLEDVAFAYALKQKGVRYQLLVADRLFTTRMYSSLGEIVEGWSKNLFLAMRRQVPLALGVALFALLTTWLPLGGLCAGVALLAGAAGGGGMNAAALGLGGLGVLQYLLVLSTQAFVRSRIKLYPRYALLAPLGALISAYIILLSAWKHRVRGQVTWKGRTFTDR